MKNNVHSAVLIIAVLSLLLGLSLGQLNEKHRELQKLEENHIRTSVIWVSPDHCNMKMKQRILMEKRQKYMESEQARMEREQARMELEKVRLEREIEQAIKRVDKERTHIILKEEL